MPTGSGIAVNAGIAGLVGELIADRISQDKAYEAARLAAPFVGFPTLTGTYPKDTTFRGLNLKLNPNAQTAVDLSSNLYPDHVQTIETGTYTIYRKNVGKFGVADIVAREWSEAYAVDLAASTATAIFETAMGTLSKDIWDLLGTSGNWATGFKADSGNITSASFDFLALIQTVTVALRGSQKWMPGMPMDVFIADDVWPHMQKLTQVLNKVNNPNANYATPEQIDGFLSSYMAGARAVRVQSTHVNASDVVTLDFSGKILFKPSRPGKQSSAFTATLGNEATFNPIQIESERSAALKGDLHFGTLYSGPTISDNTGAYLAYDLIS